MLGIHWEVWLCFPISSLYLTKYKIIIIIITTKYVTLYMKIDIHVDNFWFSRKIIFVINYRLPFLYHILCYYVKEISQLSKKWQNLRNLQPSKILRCMVCLNSLVFYLCNSLDAVSQLLITSERAWNILSSGLLLSSHPGSIMTGEESSWLPLLAPPPPPPPRPVTVVVETITMATVTVATHLLARPCISSSLRQGLLECRLRRFLLEVMWSMRDCHVTDLFRRLRHVFYHRSSWWGLLWNCCLYWGPLRPYMECDEEQFHLQPRARKFFNV